MNDSSDRVQGVATRNRQFYETAYEIAEYTDTVLTVASLAGGGVGAVTKGGTRALAGYVGSLAVGYVADEALNIVITEFDINPNIVQKLVLAKAALQIMRRGSCFPADTLVATETGLQPISEIKPGESVWAYNPDTGEWELCEVVEVFANEHDGQLVDVQIEFDRGGGETISPTAGHPLWVVHGEALASRRTIKELPLEDSIDRGTGRWVESQDLCRRSAAPARWAQRHGHRPAHPHPTPSSSKGGRGGGRPRRH